LLRASADWPQMRDDGIFLRFGALAPESLQSGLEELVSVAKKAQSGVKSPCEKLEKATSAACLRQAG